MYSSVRDDLMSILYSTIIELPNTKLTIKNSNKSNENNNNYNRACNHTELMVKTIQLKNEYFQIVWIIPHLYQLFFILINLS